jgi:hypothetical protein
MCAPLRYFRQSSAVFAAALALSMAAPAFAAGDGAATNAARPDREKRILTNDDLEAKYGKPSVTVETKAAQTVGTTESAKPATAPARSAARAQRIPPEKDPAWYAEQTVTMTSEMTAIDREAARLIQFRAPGNTPRAGTGLILSAPCEGISTDNRIAQLAAQRQAVQARLSDLEDTARHNDMPPGIFTNAEAIAQAAQPQVRLTAAQERESLADELGGLSAELAATEGIVSGMRADTAARRMTLLAPNGYGGNFTTDLLERLNAESAAIRTEINTVSDQAWRAGIPPRDLP